MAQINRKCFEYGTDPKQRQFRDVWHLWDQNIHQAVKNMDFDKDNKTIALEVAAYLTRNQYIVCRPIRDRILQSEVQPISVKKDSITQMLHNAFALLNPNKDHHSDQSLE